VADLGPNKKRIAQLLRLLSSSGGERRNAFAALERFIQSHGISWSDIGNAIECDADGKYTQEEMQEFFTAARKEGIEAGIKIGLTRAQARQQSNGHIVLPEPAEMAQYCHERLNRLKNDNERDFVSDAYFRTRRGIRLTLPKLGFLASLYIKNGGGTE
jgi:hypothetical protein